MTTFGPRASLAAAVAALILFGAGAARAETCPWKLSEMKLQAERAANRAEREWWRVKRRDPEIARLRGAALKECEPSSATRRKLEAFETVSSDYDVAGEKKVARKLFACYAEKSEILSGWRRKAEAEGDNLRLQRLGALRSKLDAVREIVFNYDLLQEKVASKIARLEKERAQLLKLCVGEDF